MANDVLDEWDIGHSRLRSISAVEIKAFWDGYVALRTGVPIRYGSLYSRWRHVGEFVISLYLTNRSVGLFVRGPRGEGHATTVHRLSAHEPDLGIALSASLTGVDGCCHLTRLPLPMIDNAVWPKAYEWLAEQEARYHRTLGDIVADSDSAASGRP